MSLVSGGSLLFCTALCFGVWLSVVVLYCSAQCVVVVVAVDLTGGLLHMLHELLRTCVDVRLFGCLCVPGLVSLERFCEAGANFPSEFGRAA